MTCETIYSLLDATEQMVADLYEVCDRGKARYPDHLLKSTEHAKVFWDTFFTGMATVNK